MSEKDQLEKILSSTALASSPSLSRFLRYIVEETLAGRHAAIREYTLGVHVFDRGADFNPRLDPIVRVQARNLRARMAKYYEGPGAEDTVRIELPKGTYVPVFHSRVVEPIEAPLAASAPRNGSPFAGSVMPVPPPRSPVAEPRIPPIGSRPRSCCSFCWASPHCTSPIPRPSPSSRDRPRSRGWWSRGI